MYIHIGEKRDWLQRSWRTSLKDSMNDDYPSSQADEMRYRL
jgi:hypothetical protein